MKYGRVRRVTVVRHIPARAPAQLDSLGMPDRQPMLIGRPLGIFLVFLCFHAAGCVDKRSTLAKHLECV